MAVDVDELPRLGQAVDGGQVDLGGGGDIAHAVALDPGIVKGVMYPQQLVQTQLPQGHGAAEGHGLAVDVPVYEGRRLLRGGKAVNGEAVLRQIFGQFLPIRHGKAPLLNILVIAVEPLAQHLVGGGDDHKGGGVGLAHRLLDGDDLPLLEGA